MKLTLQKRLASKILKISPKKVKLDVENHQEIKEALTKADVRSLIKKGIIKVRGIQNQSKSRTRKTKIQKSKGRRKGLGSRKGKKTARNPRKKAWIRKIRVQRQFISLLKEKKLISSKDYRGLYLRAKGGFFRSRRHIKTYITERGLVKHGKK